jgi:uncharacterized membrane protein YoaK (UPF0700 family)
MTGNVVFLGFAAAGASGLSVTGSLLALACFLPGGVAAGRLGARLGDDRVRQLRAASAAQIVLCTVAVAVAAAGHDFGATARYILTALLALAMGIQNATARRLAVTDLTTTVLTLTLTGIAADSRLGGGSGAKTARRTLAVAAMLVGATVVALLLLKIAPVAPLALATGILAVVWSGARRTASSTDGES